MLMLLLEVMDKEPALGTVWLAAAGLGVLGHRLARWRTWTSVPVALLIVALAAVVWLEWFDPTVGPMMRTEAGASYGWQVAGATALALFATVLGWRRSRVDASCC